MASRPAGKSVRLAPDLHATLTRRAQRDGTHGGVTGLVDRLLRDQLGGTRVNGPARAVRASSVARTERTEASCPPHPPTRRIGDGCPACGNPKAWKS